MAHQGTIIKQVRKHQATISLLEYQERYQHIERFLECCRRCHNFGQQWVCPPFDFEVNQFLAPYTTVDVIGYQLIVEPKIAQREYADVEERYQIVSDMMDWARAITDPEMLQMEQEHPGGYACYPGSCKLCGKGDCTRLVGKPCIHPDKARHSLENFGFDLSATASDLLGVPMLWSQGNRVAPYYLLVAGLLY